jgi:ABC-type uncharacterized transport system substrate-binding protein
MKRREFITLLGGAVAAWPLAARAQQRERMRRIGFLRAAPPPERDLGAFLRGLASRGWVHGRDFVLITQWGDGNVARLPELAVALVNGGVDIILAEGVVTTRAARAVTTDIPIVMAGGADPFVGGLVKSLARPGANVTGMSALAPELASKRVELLKEVVPRAERVAVLWNSSSQAKVTEWKDMQEPARNVSLTLRSFETRSPEELDSALAAIGRDLPDALLTFTDGFTIAFRQRIGSFALANRLPMISEVREFAEAGGVATYGTNRADLWRRSASYVDKIMRGANPGDLPVEQPTRFEMVINLNHAKAIGLDLPPTLLARADEVIE